MTLKIWNLPPLSSRAKSRACPERTPSANEGESNGDLLFLCIVPGTNRDHASNPNVVVCDGSCTHPFAQNAKGWGTLGGLSGQVLDRCVGSVGAVPLACIDLAGWARCLHNPSSESSHSKHAKFGLPDQFARPRGGILKSHVRPAERTKGSLRSHFRWTSGSIKI